MKNLEVGDYLVLRLDIGVYYKVINIDYVADTITIHKWCSRPGESLDTGGFDCNVSSIKIKREDLNRTCDKI